MASQRMQGPRALLMFIPNLAEGAGECPESCPLAAKLGQDHDKVLEFRTK